MSNQGNRFKSTIITSLIPMPPSAPSSFMRFISNSFSLLRLVQSAKNISKNTEPSTFAFKCSGNTTNDLFHSFAVCASYLPCALDVPVVFMFGLAFEFTTSSCPTAAAGSFV